MAKIIRNKTLQENGEWDWVKDVMNRNRYPLSYYFTEGGRSTLKPGQTYHLTGELGIYDEPNLYDPVNCYIKLDFLIEDSNELKSFTMLEPVRLGNARITLDVDDSLILHKEVDRNCYLELVTPEEVDRLNLNENNDFDWIKDIPTPPTEEELKRDPERLIGWRLQNEFNDLIINKYNKKGKIYKALNLTNNQTHYLSLNFMLNSIFIRPNLKMVYNPDGIRNNNIKEENDFDWVKPLLQDIGGI